MVIYLLRFYYRVCLKEWVWVWFSDFIKGVDCELDIWKKWGVKVDFFGVWGVVPLDFWGFLLIFLDIWYKKGLRFLIEREVDQQKIKNASENKKVHPLSWKKSRSQKSQILKSYDSISSFKKSSPTKILKKCCHKALNPSFPSQHPAK